MCKFCNFFLFYNPKNIKENHFHLGFNCQVLKSRETSGPNVTMIAKIENS